MLHSVLTRARMFSLALVLLGLTVATPGSARDFEVWLVDQSDSFGKTYGGTIYIYEGADVNGADASAAENRHPVIFCPSSCYLRRDFR